MQHLDILLTFVLVLAAARLAGAASRLVGMPAVLGELLAGLVVGPSLLNLVHSGTVLDTVADIGVLLLLFIAGLETDLLHMKMVGKASLLAALGGVAFPLIGGLAFGAALGLTLPAALFVGVALTATSVSVSVQVLKEAGSLRTRPGMVIMGAAIADDIIGIVLLSLVLGMEGQAPGVGFTLLRLVLFFPLAVLAGHFALRPALAWVRRHHAAEAGMALVLAIVLLYAWSAEALGGLAAITGAYLAGVMISRLPEAKEWVSDGALVMGQGLFVPVFFVTVGLRADLHLALAAPALVLGLTGIAVATKAIGAALGARAGGCDRKEAQTIGAGMIARGEVALVVAALGLNNGIISSSVFTVVIVMTLATTLVTPLLLKLALNRPAMVDAGLPAAALATVPVETEDALGR
jgi:Kef-type K+ transport system membrane component KefB